MCTGVKKGVRVSTKSMVCGLGFHGNVAFLFLLETRWNPTINFINTVKLLSE